jgi:hypothetical protein
MIFSPHVNFLSLIWGRLWLRELTSREAIPLLLNPTVWRDKPLADVMSLGIWSGLQLLCRFCHVRRGRKAFYIWESQSRGTNAPWWHEKPVT